MTAQTHEGIHVGRLYKVFGADPASVMPLVHEGISKQDLLETHGHVLGLRDINLDVAPRSIQVVMGLSGSGKSTLVRHINRLIDPTEGDVRIDGEDMLALDAAALKRLRRYKISMVFQRFALFPHRTVMDNVGYGLASRVSPRASVPHAPRNGWSASASRATRSPTRTTSPAACSSGSASLAPSRPTPTSC